MGRQTKYLLGSFLVACVALLWVYEKATETFTATGFVRIACENEQQLSLIINHMTRQLSLTDFRAEIIASCTNGHELTCKDVRSICAAVSNANWEIVANDRGVIRLSVVAQSRGISHDVAAACLQGAKQLMDDENASLIKASTGQLSNNVRRAQIRLDKEKRTGTRVSISRAEDNLKNAVAKLGKARETLSQNLIQVDVVGPFVIRSHGKVFMALHGDHMNGEG